MRPHPIEDKEKLLLFFSTPNITLQPRPESQSAPADGFPGTATSLQATAAVEGLVCRFGEGGGGVSPELRGTSNAEGSGDVLICGGASLEQSPSISPQGAELEIEIRRRPKQINPTLRSSKFCKCFNPDST